MSVAGFDNWDVFAPNPPGRGRPVADLPGSCPACDRPLRSEPTCASLTATMLARFVLDADELAEFNRMVLLRCDECGFHATGQR